MIEYKVNVMRTLRIHTIAVAWNMEVHYVVPKINLTLVLHMH